MADYVNLRDQRSMTILLPSREVRSKFVERVKPLLQFVDNLRMQNTTLQQSRDLLLPRLISGELDVTNLDLPTETTASQATV